MVLMKLTLGSGRKIIPREKVRGAGNSAGADNTSKREKTQVPGELNNPNIGRD